MFLFVYGTLISSEYNHQYLRGSKLVGETHTFGSLYDIGEYPALISDGENCIKGELYKIDDTVLKECDLLEGYDELDIVNSNYVREEISVIFEDKEYYCYVYYCNFNVENYPEIKSGNYKKHMMKKRNENKNT
jgi:gamma-glutamylcyclotransferase (GGCT)/AIG2-like uncharacterized protein YtfP|tara:strand:- start:470 stop:868 length:399 start_codon:yes stop_codon:yes gene_type:complete